MQTNSVSFFKCTPNRTLTFKGDNYHGGKKSKERVTVMVKLLANMIGTEKLKLGTRDWKVNTTKMFQEKERGIVTSYIRV